VRPSPQVQDAILRWHSLQEERLKAAKSIFEGVEEGREGGEGYVDGPEQERVASKQNVSWKKRLLFARKAAYYLRLSVVPWSIEVHWVSRGRRKTFRHFSRLWWLRAQGYSVKDAVLASRTS
jgi:hypothetical protein